MKQRLAWLVVPVLALTACSGGGGAEASLDEWCAIAQRIEDGAAALDEVPDDDTAAARAALEQLQEVMDDAAKVAPDDILADVNTVADGFDRFARILAGVDYDLSSLDEGAISDLEEIATSQDDATARIERFNERECGITADVDEQAGDEGPETTVPTSDEVAPVVDTTAPAVPETTEVRFTGDPDSEWCAAAREIDTIDEGFEDILFAGPADVEAYMTEFVSRVESAAAVAPPEIADAVATNLEGLRALDAAFAAAGYDALDADLSAIADLQSELDAASDVIDAYNVDVCGLEPSEADSGDDDSEFDPTAGSIRDQTVAELVALGFTEEEAACIFEGIDFTDPDFANDAGRIIEVFGGCGIDLARLAELGGG